MNNGYFRNFVSPSSPSQGVFSHPSDSPVKYKISEPRPRFEINPVYLWQDVRSHARYLAPRRIPKPSEWMDRTPQGVFCYSADRVYSRWMEELLRTIAGIRKF